MAKGEHTLSVTVRPFGRTVTSQPMSMTVATRRVRATARVRGSYPAETPSWPCGGGPWRHRTSLRAFTAIRVATIDRARATGGPGAGQGSMVTLIASPAATVLIASGTLSSGIRWVIRSATGTAPEAIRSRARLLWDGLEPLAPTTVSSR